MTGCRLETRLKEEAVRGRRLYVQFQCLIIHTRQHAQERSLCEQALIDDALGDDISNASLEHVLFCKQTVPYERSDDARARLCCAPNADEFTLYTREEVVESIFENYLCRWEGINDAIEKLSGTIDAARKLLELTLDNERNRIERMELYISMGGLSFAMMSAVGGFFGMNLFSGLENRPNMFWIVTHSALACSFTLWYICWQRFHLGRQIQNQQVNGIVGDLRRALVPQIPPTFF